MNFQELQQKIGDQSKSDWSQHENGGGWVNIKAKVATSAYVGEHAVIFSGTVFGDARVYGDAWVCGDAQVFGDAWVYGNAQVCGDAQVFGDAWVYGNARVYGDAQVCGDAWDRPPLFIIGSKHTLTNCKRGYIQIGCHCKKIGWWVKNYEKIGEREGYTTEEIAEYGEFIKLFKKMGR